MEEKIKSIERIENNDGRVDLKVQCAEREYVLHNVKFKSADDCLEYDDATPSEVNLKFEYDIATESKSKKDKLTPEDWEILIKAFNLPLSVEAEKAYDKYPYAGKSNQGVFDTNSELRKVFVLGWHAHEQEEAKNNELRVTANGVTIPWEVLEEMWTAMLEKSVNANHSNKKLYHQGQAVVYERLLSLKDNLEMKTI